MRGPKRRQRRPPLQLQPARKRPISYDVLLPYLTYALLDRAIRFLWGFDSLLGTVYVTGGLSIAIAASSQTLPEARKRECVPGGLLHSMIVPASFQFAGKRGCLPRLSFHAPLISKPTSLRSLRMP